MSSNFHRDGFAESSPAEDPGTLRRFLDLGVSPVLREPRLMASAVRRLASIWRLGGTSGVRDWVTWKLTGVARPCPAHDWYMQYRPTPRLLRKFRAARWPEHAPKFSIIVWLDDDHEPVQEPAQQDRTSQDRISQALESLCEQTYPYWEALCLKSKSCPWPLLDSFAMLAGRESRLRLVAADDAPNEIAARNMALRQATGDYLLVLNPGVLLEPQALHRIATAALESKASLLYGDEAFLQLNGTSINGIAARGRYSYDEHLARGELGSVVALSTASVRAAGGWDENREGATDFDLQLRLIERGASVAHVADILCRRRSTQSSRLTDTHEETLAAVDDHLQRIGLRAKVHPTPVGDKCDLHFELPANSRVAIIVPTKNRHDLLQACVDSLERTLAPQSMSLRAHSIRPSTAAAAEDKPGSPLDRAELYVINHESDDPQTRRYLSELSPRHRVVPFRGPFNFSAMMNLAVEDLPPGFTHYLFLNNDIEACNAGWLDHMLGLACRDDVGIVGATLLYPDGAIQHAGVVAGACGSPTHVHARGPFRDGFGQRLGGFHGELLATRDVSAVTGACMLVRADVFDAVGGFDERMAVGCGDVDLCLRVRQAGFKVIQDAHAVLIHHESKTRGKCYWGSHPEDTALFRRMHSDTLHDGDPYYSPLLSPISGQYVLNRRARCGWNATVHIEHPVLPVARSVEQEPAPAVVPTAIPAQENEAA